MTVCSKDGTCVNRKQTLPLSIGKPCFARLPFASIYMILLTENCCTLINAGCCNSVVRYCSSNTQSTQHTCSHLQLHASHAQLSFISQEQQTFSHCSASISSQAFTMPVTVTDLVYTVIRLLGSKVAARLCPTQFYFWRLPIVPACATPNSKHTPTSSCWVALACI